MHVHQLNRTPCRHQIVNQDIAVSALEGLTEEQKAKVRKRAAWMAERFIRNRTRAGQLFCDNCRFDQATKIDGTRVKARSLLHVHHMNPLAEGALFTTEADFCFVCPNCHRFMHRLAATFPFQCLIFDFVCPDLPKDTVALQNCVFPKL
jgi:5-methylcytosine-specific restriction protein A